MAEERKHRRNGLIVDMYPQEFIDLQEELMKPDHALLVQDVMIDVEVQDFEIILAKLCARLNIALDGNYSRTDLARVCDICVQRLRKRRGSIYVPTVGGLEI